MSSPAPAGALERDAESPAARAARALRIHRSGTRAGLRAILEHVGLPDVAEAADVNPAGVLLWLQQTTYRA